MPNLLQTYNESGYNIRKIMSDMHCATIGYVASITKQVNMPILYNVQLLKPKQKNLNVIKGNQIVCFALNHDNYQINDEVFIIFTDTYWGNYIKYGNMLTEPEGNLNKHTINNGIIIGKAVMTNDKNEQDYITITEDGIIVHTDKKKITLQNEQYQTQVTMEEEKITINNNKASISIDGETITATNNKATITLNDDGLVNVSNSQANLADLLTTELSNVLSNNTVTGTVTTPAGPGAIDASAKATFPKESLYKAKVKLLLK